MSNVTRLFTRSIMTEPAECPIPWCSGTVRNHEGSGDSPDQWTHSGPLRELGMSYVGLNQLGSGRITLEVILDSHDSYSSDGLRKLAGDLSGLALRLLDQATQVDAMNRAMESTNL